MESGVEPASNPEWAPLHRSSEFPLPATECFLPATPELRKKLIDGQGLIVVAPRGSDFGVLVQYVREEGRRKNSRFLLRGLRRVCWSVTTRRSRLTWLRIKAHTPAAPDTQELRRALRSKVRILPSPRRRAPLRLLLKVEDDLELIDRAAAELWVSSAVRKELLTRPDVAPLLQRLKRPQTALGCPPSPAQRVQSLTTGLLWRKHLKGSNFDKMPGDAPLPQLLNGDRPLLLSSIGGEPAAVYALSQKTGRIIWRVRLRLAHHPVVNESGQVLVHGPRQILLIDGSSGRVVWRYPRRAYPREKIYSTPVWVGEQICFGDRDGYLNFLDADTGELTQRVLTSDASNNGVNTQPVVRGNLVIVGTNAQQAVAFGADTGEPIWRTQLEFTPLGMLGETRDCVVLACRKGYAWVEVASGKLLATYGAPSTTFCMVGDRLVAAVGDIDDPPFLVGVEQGVEVFRQPSDSLHDLRFDSGTGLIYAACWDGVCLIDPHPGKTLVKLQAAVGELLWTAPLAAAGKLYIPMGYDYVTAVRHPDVTGLVDDCR